MYSRGRAIGHRAKSVAKDRLSDAGGLGFESQTGRVTGKSTPSLSKAFASNLKMPVRRRAVIMLC